MLLRRVVVTVVGGLLLSACQPAADDPTSSLPGVEQPDAAGVAFAGSGVASELAAAPDALPPLRALAPAGPGRLTARTDQPFLWTWSAPGRSTAPVTRLATTNPFGQTMTFLVEDIRSDADGTDWLRIRTGEFPNDDMTWIRASDVRLGSVSERIVVDLSERRLVRYVDGEVHTRLRIAIGDPDTPTVPGRYFVWARVRYTTPGGPYGTLALGLSGFSEVVRFGPNPGRLAIHGTADPTDRGRAVSLGCVRVHNDEIERLWSVPMGTPVLIRR